MDRINTEEKPNTIVRSTTEYSLDKNKWRYVQRIAYWTIRQQTNSRSFKSQTGQLADNCQLADSEFFLYHGKIIIYRVPQKSNPL